MIRFKYYIKKPSLALFALVQKINWAFPDNFYLKILYRLRMGISLDLNNPMRFSEKLQWLKLYNRKPIYTSMVDKVTAKEFVAKIIGEKYIIPTLGVWDKFEEIDFDMLPNKFVLKTNHSGGGNGVVICHDKTTFDIECAKKKLNLSLKKSVYKLLREWPYKDIKPKIFAEELLEDFDIYGLRDYKVFCCNGTPKMIKVNYHDKENNYRVGWYSPEWMPRKGTTICDPIDDNVVFPRPKPLLELLSVARELSKGIPYLRVDFYCVNDVLWFGEMTFFPGSGFERFVPDSFDYEIGSWIELPKKTN